MSTITVLPVTATLINLFHICHRELWLHANHIRMEHSSDTVADGKLTHEISYPQRAEKYTEIMIDGSKIDFYDAKNKVVHEIKRSDKAEQAHVAQVKYYLWLLEMNGVEGAIGLLEYPKLRQTSQVILTEADREQIPVWLEQIRAITGDVKCPPTVKKPICRSCSYNDFCYVGEVESLEL